MSTIERTAYPRYSKRQKLKQSKLAKYYTLTKDEIEWMNKAAKTNALRLSFAIQLKVFQNLRYFIPLNEVPNEIIDHLRHTAKFHSKLSYGYDENSSTTLYKHRMKIRAYLQVTKWGKEMVGNRTVNLARKAAIKSAYEISQVMNNIPDIINAVIEHLVHRNYELPGFYALNRLVRHTRHKVNNKIFNKVYNKISDSQSQLFISLIDPNEMTYQTMFI